MAYGALGLASEHGMARDRQRLREDHYLYIYSIIALASFCFRDALTAAMRYYLDMVGLGVLWFVPDVLAFGSVAAFIAIVCVRDKNPIAIFFLAFTLFSIFIAAIFFSGSITALSSAVKMYIPMVVGFCFRGRSVLETKTAQRLMFIVFFASSIGIIANPYFQYPWFGYATIDAFGNERVASKLWWAAGVVRYGGLAGDSTMGAFMTLFSYVMISPFHGVLVNVLCWPIAFLALQTSTSKTALGLFCIYVVIYCILIIFPKYMRLKVLRKMTLASFLCILAPPLLMVLLGGVDLTDFNKDLSSFADRINNTWGGPFAIIAEIFPVGLFSGCGLGCYAYPMTYTPLKQYHLPLDNFYLTTFLMTGYPFMIFVVLIVLKTRTMMDPVKLTLILMWNIYSVTVQGYGPSYATLIFGYAISEAFANPRSRKRTNGGVDPARDDISPSPLHLPQPAT